MSHGEHSQEQRARIAPLVAPSITTLNPAGGSTAGGNQVTITGSGLTGATSVHFGSTASFTAVSDTQVNAIAPAGSGTVAVNVTTPSGTTNSLSYTYVAPGPSLTGLNPGSGPAAGGTTVILTGTSLSGANAVHFGAGLAAFTVVSSTQINAIAPAGSGTVAVNVTTAAGTSNSLSYTYVPTPTITSINPSQGALPGGNTVSLTGTGFTSATAVTFGSTPAVSFTVVDSSHITAVAPGGNPPGQVQVTVTTSAGTSNGVSYFFIAAPTVTAVTPNQGPTAGGNSVTVTGTGFTGASAVRFGAAAASSLTVVTDSQLTALAPAGTGTVQVTVTTAGGVSTTSAAGAYTYLAGPTLTSLVPNQGPTSGGNSVTLTGANLTFTNAVRFGSTPASFAVLSDTQIVATAPATAAGGVSVTVSTPGGTSPGAAYIYLAPPGS